MLEQPNNALIFDFFYRNANGEGVSGLTLTVDVYQGTTLIINNTSLNITEVGGGWYFYTLISSEVDLDAHYRAIAKTSSTSVAQRHQPSLWVVGLPWVNRIVDTYQAKVEFIDDDDGTADRYVVSWFVNGEPVSGAITTPVLQVIKVADGTDLIPATAMTAIPGDNSFTYTATGAERMVSGVAYLAIATATIAVLTREWKQPVGVDS